MKKKLLLSILSISMVFGLLAQSVQNPGFEDWEDAGTVIDEPVNWSSIKTSDGGDLVNGAAPVVWGQSEDAHTGNYSIELTNVLTIGTIIATGTITNGRVHAEFNPAASYVFTNPDVDGWHTSLSGRPDSVAIWAKYTPVGTDTAQVKVVLHTDEGSLPPTAANQANIIGYAQINISETVNNWTRFVAPFSYSSQNDPEYMLCILSSGAGFLAVEGSKAFYDDMELIYNPDGVNDLLADKTLLYLSDNTIFLNKIPEHKLKDANIEIRNLNGSIMLKEPVNSNEIKIQQNLISEGIYLVRIYGQEFIYSQKIYLK